MREMPDAAFCEVRGGSAPDRRRSEERRDQRPEERRAAPPGRQACVAAWCAPFGGGKPPISEARLTQGRENAWSLELSPPESAWVRAKRRLRLPKSAVSRPPERCAPDENPSGMRGEGRRQTRPRARPPSPFIAFAARCAPRPSSPLRARHRPAPQRTTPRTAWPSLGTPPRDPEAASSFGTRTFPLDYSTYIE